MKATITYDLPEELPELLVHLKGQTYLTVLWELDQWLRSKDKYGDKDWADEVSQRLREEMEERGCSLEDGECTIY